jgi:hypothetical protein
MEPHVYLDTPWWHYSAMFATAGAAWETWQQIEEELAGKNLDLGVYRHGSSTNPGKCITVVSLQPQGVLRARRIIRKAGGREGYSHPNTEELEALIARRIRFVAKEAPKGEAGHAEIHHLGHGTELRPDGTYS